MCGGNRRSWQRSKMGSGAGSPTGNRAFDDYREETLSRLEHEAREFREFVDQLRKAQDKEAFDRFMAQRRAGGSSPAPAQPAF